MNTTTNNIETVTPDAVRRLNRDLVKSATTLSVNEARYLVDAYYQLQEYRKAACNQVRAMEQAQEPHGVIAWFYEQNETMEEQIKRALDSWTEAVPAARWAKSIVGIGPVISAGLAAHIDIARCITAAPIWRFAGLDPTVEWKKGEKRPWNASLKTLCWKIGESFVKVSNHPDDFYGRLYQQRKDYEQRRNEAGKLADQARRKLERFNIGKNTEAYQHYAAGHLPPAHIHARAKRWVVKLFLSHYSYVAWTLATGTPPPKPYAVAILGRCDVVRPPNWNGL